MLFFHRISAKVILITLFIMGLMTVIVFTLFWYRLYSTAEELLVGQAASFTELAEHFKTAIVPMGGSDGNAGLDSAKHAAQENGLEFNVWALNPTNPDFNPENASSAKTFRTKMMRDLMEQAKRGAGDSISRIDPDTRVIHYMKAIRLDNKCMECHSPDIANTNLHGAFEGALPTSRVKVAVFQTLKAAFLLTLPLTILIMILYVVYIKRIVTRPLKIIMNSANSIAKGDIDQSVDYRSRDEIGMVADAFREMIAYIRGAAEAAESFSQGNLNHRVTRKSDRDVLSIHLNRAMEVLDGPFQEIRTMVGEYKKGNLTARGNANQFEGSFAELIVDINRMMDAVLEPIREATVVLERIAEKDLTVRVTGDYQGDLARLKKALNKTIDNLEDSIGYFSNSVNDLLTASQQISQSSQSIAQGASEQASSFEEVSAILEEMSGMTKQVSRDAGQARSLSQTTLQSAEVGNRAVSDMTTDMGKIKQTANQTAKIVKTIDEIAFQTNLLALNAAVEAARAGEAGKGFAVVAEEVRNLAHRSAAAAKSTSELIDESITNVDQGVKAMNNVYRDFQSILHNIRSIHTLIDAVATASQEQNVGIDQVNLAVSQLNIVTQQNAASSEESAAAAGSLTKQAHDLDDIVGEFTWEGERQYRILSVETRRNRRLPSGN